ncbi:protein phosphatase 2C-related protein [Tieghemostelium lacteum]|uniref:Protein phosphatase 2C-related protein n=1 Tax=Tieghemostelium lacteum TaxID=361077 RepID=A0A151ZET3_TIELA|nr:protein phosphatase 2C-related protein [Tieghemostelium lacteum]|eukprot:KYQ92435.1 protein phosphatase 2C-related protein [Tieghemostelium lacteum]
MSELDESLTSNETLNTTKTTTSTENVQESNKLLEVSIDKKETDMNIENNNNEPPNNSENTENNSNTNTSSSSTSTSTTTNSDPTLTPTHNHSAGDNCNNNNEPSTPLASDSFNTSTSSNNSPAKPKIHSVKDIGVSYEKNPRFRRTMEDEHVIIDRFANEDSSGYFAIYDGHGGRGAVEFTAKTLHNNLLDEINKNPNGDMLAYIRESYLLTDRQMEKDNVLFSGTTAISALIRKNQNGERYLYVANAGDARAVICEDKKAIRLSHDHKGSDADEAKRIVDAGGFVVNHRVNGILAVTRSLGDHSMKDYVIGDPYMRTIKLDDTHTHLILACDGLWDVTSDQESTDLIINETDAQNMSEKLLNHALKKGSTDNISIIVIIL